MSGKSLIGRSENIVLPIIEKENISISKKVEEIHKPLDISGCGKVNFHEIKSLLQVYLVLLHFKKADGKERLMLATTNLSIADKISPSCDENDLYKVKGREDEQKGNVAVFDVFIGDGRMFCVDRVLHWKVYLEPEYDFASILRWMDEQTRNWNIEEEKRGIF